MSVDAFTRAIPTLYAGVQFRSRLEAKWAAFFDVVGWQWEYEPEGFPGWIPDFALFCRQAILLVEVKPTMEFPAETILELSRLANGREIAILGQSPFRYDTPSGPYIGWLRDPEAWSGRHPDYPGWGDAAIGGTGADVAIVPGDRESVGRDPVHCDDARAWWRRACNAVQWRAPA